MPCNIGIIDIDDDGYDSDYGNYGVMVAIQPAFFGRHGHLCLISLLGEEAKQDRKVWCKWHGESETRTACFQSVFSSFAPQTKH